MTKTSADLSEINACLLRVEQSAAIAVPYVWLSLVSGSALVIYAILTSIR
jgi:hypothetical protein